MNHTAVGKDAAPAHPILLAGARRLCPPARCPHHAGCGTRPIRRGRCAKRCGTPTDAAADSGDRCHNAWETVWGTRA